MAALVLVLALGLGAGAQELAADLTDLPLEALMELEVTSVSKRRRKLSRIPGAVFVITQEDIRRSGATTIPDLLRMVPGINAARVDSSRWAVAARGLNGHFANKLLVLVDGRSVYLPFYGAVFWEVQDLLFEDIERIEVVRGPGGTIWGANAVNGVINIITKHAGDTQGGLVSAGAGTEERGFAGLRYGGKLGARAYYRVYAKHFDRDEQVDEDGNDAADRWHASRAGFRLDWTPSEVDAITVHGDFHNEKVRHTQTRWQFTPPYALPAMGSMTFTGQNVMFRWTRRFSEDSELACQVYYDRVGIRERGLIDYSLNTVDVDVSHTLRLCERHEIVWGFGYRFMSDSIGEEFLVDFDPSHRRDHLLSAFVQDEVAVVRDHLWLTLGSKIEHNSYTGVEVQPGGKLTWVPRDGHTLWASVSRAVRTASRAEHDARYIGLVQDTGQGFAQVVTFEGNREFDSEELLAYELGYRAQLTPRLAIDVALFLNRYDNLWTSEPGTPTFRTTPVPHLVTPLHSDNRLQGDTCGLEVAAHYRVCEGWRLDAAYSYLRMDLELDSDSNDPRGTTAEGESPRHQFSLRSSLDLPFKLELDLWLRFVDELPSLDVPGYVTADLRLGWRPRHNLELYIVGQNLLQSHHPEFTAEYFSMPSTEVQRGFYIGGRLRF